MKLDESRQPDQNYDITVIDHQWLHLIILQQQFGVCQLIFYRDHKTLPWLVLQSQWPCFMVGRLLGWGISISFPEFIDFTEWSRIRRLLTFLKTTFSFEEGRWNCHILTGWIWNYQMKPLDWQVPEETDWRTEGGCGGGEAPGSLLRGSTDLSSVQTKPWSWARPASSGAAPAPSQPCLVF